MPASVVGNPVVPYGIVTLHGHVNSFTIVDDAVLTYEIIEIVNDTVLVSNLSAPSTHTPLPLRVRCRA